MLGLAESKTTFRAVTMTKICATYLYPKSLRLRSTIETVNASGHLYSNFIHYLWRLGLLTVIIYVVSYFHVSYFHDRELDAYIYVVITVVLSAILAIESRINWEKSTKKIAQEDYTLVVEADDSCVQVKHIANVTAIDWCSYAWCIEEDNTLKIKSKNGVISFIPKLPETAEIIEFTKTKIKLLKEKV